MMVSDFIALVGRLVTLNVPQLILMTIAVIVTGAVTHKVAISIQSSVALTVTSLVVLLIWFQLWEAGTSIHGILATACLVVAGYDGYRRLIG